MPKRGQRMRVESVGKRARYCRMRIADPIGFDPRSMRLRKVKEGVKMIVGCPKGKYDAILQRCEVGTRPQSLLKRKTKKGTCPVFNVPRKLVK